MGVFLLFDGAREVFALIVGMGQGSILFNEGEAHKGRQVQGKGASPLLHLQPCPRVSQLRPCLQGPGGQGKAP